MCVCVCMCDYVCACKKGECMRQYAYTQLNTHLHTQMQMHFCNVIEVVGHNYLVVFLKKGPDHNLIKPFMAYFDPPS
jgi:hypothetical protein